MHTREGKSAAYIHDSCLPARWSDNPVSRAPAALTSDVTPHTNEFQFAENLAQAQIGADTSVRTNKKYCINPDGAQCLEESREQLSDMQQHSDSRVGRFHGLVIGEFVGCGAGSCMTMDLATLMLQSEISLYQVCRGSSC